MAMNKLIDEVKELIEKEYGRAGAKFGLTHHCDHHSYAVLLEELEEAQDEMRFVDKYMNEFWVMVKNDDNDYGKFTCCGDIERSALMCACEMIQVAAMAKKAALTICDRAAVVEIGAEGGETS